MKWAILDLDGVRLAGARLQEEKLMPINVVNCFKAQLFSQVRDCSLPASGERAEAMAAA